MKNDKRTAYVERDTILALLSETELAQVSAAESGAALADGVEFIDLEHLDRGVRLAPRGDTPLAHILARTSVGSETWGQIVKALGKGPGATRTEPA
ncbi:MAG: hypothetical protein K8W52_24070 [Deltaproteobacteria bacterium]|nr:hypothetical protein [Deltaproteobacteria bacterium]